MLHIQISAKHKIIAVPTAENLRNLFPDAPKLTLQGKAHLALPHQPNTTFLLRQLGYEVPAPILSHYDWRGGKPFEVQRRTCAMLSMNQRAYVLSGMGTGKSKAALWAWDYLHQHGFAQRMLVVAPLSTLKFTWAREVFNTLPGVKVNVLYGSKEKRLAQLKDEADIYVINHDGLKVIHDEVMARTDIDTLVLDELAVYRNGSAKRSKMAQQLAARMNWIWGMTGTPIPNDPTDVWAQARIITPHSVPKYFGRFRDELMTKVSQFRFVPKPDAVDRAFNVLQPSVRFTLDDVIELPQCVSRTIDVDMGTRQSKVYKQLVEHAHAAIGANEITAANAGAVMMKLLQVSCGWVYSSNGTVTLDNEARVQALLDALDAADKKVLVFVNFKHALAGLSEVLAREGYDHASVSGDTPAGTRGEIFNAFQNTSKYKVLLAHPQCLAHGLTLTAATTVVWFNPTTSLEIYEQANARISRIGQTQKQLVLHLQGSPVEKKIYALLRTKQRVQNKLLELIEGASKETEA
jgi:SNF2 family DNA or RNA helicase